MDAASPAALFPFSLTHVLCLGQQESCSRAGGVSLANVVEASFPAHPADFLSALPSIQPYVCTAVQYICTGIHS